ncbi:MAG: hypothetical protein ACKOX1_09120 [Ignavibacteria bacterium]
MMIRSFILLIMVCSVYAQDSKNTADQPLDLQEFVITGKTNADIKGGLKMKPTKPGILTRAELDSINTDIKIPIPLLPAIPLPASPMKPYSVNGYVNGEFGIFMTPAINAGYSFSAGGYSIDVFGNYEGSQGHIDNADFTKTGLTLQAAYDAPKKFVFFGGSRTETGVSYASNTYQLFGADKSRIVERSLDALGAQVDVKGTIGSYAYSMGALWQSLTLGTDSLSNSDGRIQGYAHVTTPMFGMSMSGNLMVDIHSYGDTSSYNFIQAGTSGTWTDDAWTFNIGAGLQTATNSDGVQFGAISLIGNVDYRLSTDFTTSLRCSSGLQNNSLSEMIKRNPYVMHMPSISFRRDDFVIAPMIHWHPDIDWTASLKASYQSSSSMPVMLPNSTESGKFQGFAIEYLSGTLLDIQFEGQWKPLHHTRIGAFASLISSSLSDSSVAIPMMAPLTIGLRYERDWFTSFHSLISLEYIGARTVTKDASIELPSYIMANFRLNYTIQKDLEAYIRIDNLLNSSVYVWNRFRERGTFVALGARYLF